MERNTILVVDDESSVLSAIQRMLRKETFQVLTASSAEDAFDILKKHDAQVIISDHRLPGMRGIDFLHEVKKQYPDSMRIILSGHAEIDTVMEAINHGEVYRFLSKPWSDEELKTTIIQCLENYNLVQENRALTKDLKKKNAQLEEVLQDRTNALRLTQEILEYIPVPLIGLSADGEVAMVNSACTHLLPEEALTWLGMDYKSVFPEEISQALDLCTSNQQNDNTFQSTWHDKTININIGTLSEASQQRGFVLALQEVIK